MPNSRFLALCKKQDRAWLRRCATGKSTANNTSPKGTIQMPNIGRKGPTRPAATSTIPAPIRTGGLGCVFKYAIMRSRFFLIFNLMWELLHRRGAKTVNVILVDQAIVNRLNDQDLTGLNSTSSNRYCGILLTTRRLGQHVSH